MGPETEDRNNIIEMLHAGMDIARFELTRENQEQVRKRMQNLQEILVLMNKMGRTPELLPLQHCKIMVDIAEPFESCTLVNSK